MKRYLMDIDDVVKELQAMGFGVSYTPESTKSYGYRVSIAKDDAIVTKTYYHPWTFDAQKIACSYEKFLDELLIEYDIEHKKAMALKRRKEGDRASLFMATIEAITNSPDQRLSGDLNSGYVYVNNDIEITNKIRKRMPMFIKKVIFNAPATIVFWSDGDKTVVKAINEPYDAEKGLAMAISKKVIGNEGNYYNTFKKWLPEENSKTINKTNEFAAMDVLNKAIFNSKATKKDLLNAMNHAWDILAADVEGAD